MESLAPELLHAILSDLDTAELANLMIAGRSFSNHIEPILYGTVERREKTLHWACVNGNHTLIRQAISHGSSPSVIEPFPPRLAPVLTLYVAAKHNRINTFSFLMQLGAGIGPSHPAPLNSLRGQVKLIMRWLAKTPNLNLLQTFLNKGLDAEVKAMHSPAVAWPLVPSINSGASAALVRTLLDHGASANMVLSNGKGAMQSPLSAAILAGSQAVVRELIATGADVGGQRRREGVPAPPGQYPTHLPMFAAAMHLATSVQRGEAEVMLTLCLQSGGNINQRACFVTKTGRFYWLTPLLMFLDTVPAWSKDGNDRLAFLIDRKASRPPTEDSPPDIAMPLRHLYYDDIQSPSTVATLFDRWGIAQLRYDDFFTTVEMLIQNDLTSLADITDLLDRGCRVYNVRDSEAKVVSTRWCKLLDIVVSHLQASIDVDTILANVIIFYGKGKVFPAGSTHILDATIDHLLVIHGGDINAPAAPKGHTALHHLCKFYCAAATNSMLSHFDDSSGWYITIPRSELFTLLVEKGTDPTLVFDGETAIQVLREGFERANKTNQPILFGLVNIVELASKYRKV